MAEPHSFAPDLRVTCAVLALVLPLAAAVSPAGASFINRRIAAPASDLAGRLSVTTEAQPLISALPRWRGGCLWPFVNLYSGNLYLEYHALSAPAIGFDWDLRFHYNSSLTSELSTLGRGWRHSYDAALLINVPAAGSITARWGDGRRDVYTTDGSGWSGPAWLEGRRIVTIAGGYRLSTKHGDRYEYDALGRLVRLKDRNANTTNLTYDGSGRLTTIADPTGRNVVFTYDGSSRVATVSGLTPAVIQLGYTGDRLTVITESPGFPRAYSYDGLGRLVRTVDADGRETTFEYLSNLNVVERVRASVARREFFYDTGTRTTVVRDSVAPAENIETSYVFNPDGTCAQAVNADGGTTNNSYHPSSLAMLSHTDAGGHPWSWTYNTVNDMLTATDPTMGVTTWDYDPTFHLRTQMTDAAGKLWQWQRDGNGNVTTFLDPLLHPTSWGYDTQGLPQTMTDALSQTTYYYYDGYGHLTQVTDPAGFSVQATYDTRGHYVTLTDQSFNTTSIFRDGRDDPTQLNLPGGSWSFQWLNSGLLESVTDPQTYVTRYAYDALDRLVRTVDANLDTTKVHRDGAGREKTLEDANGRRVLYEYDAMDRLIRREDPDAGVWNFVFAADELESTVSPLGEITRFHFTPRHQADSVRTADIVNTYSYDAMDRLITAQRVRPTEPTIGYSYVYDDAGRLTSKTSTHLGNTTTFTLDDLGDVTTVTDAILPVQWIYSYDSRRLPQQLTIPALGLDVGITWTPRRQLNGVSYSPMGTSTSLYYDAPGRLTSLYTSSSGFSENYGMGYSPRGELTSMSAFTPATGFVSMSANYDPVRRLLQESYSSGQTFTYSYDAVGNRISKNGPGGFESYGYSTGYRLLTAGSLTQNWNANGAVLSATYPGTTQSYTYRPDGSLATGTHNGQLWRFVPGPFGERARLTSPAGTHLWQDYDVGPRGILRRSIYTNPGTSPVEVQGFFQPGCRATPAFRVTASTTQPMIRGPLGISAVANNTGGLVGGRFYSLFGERLAATGAASITPGFLAMDVLQEPALPYGAGLSAERGLGSAPMDVTYLSRTGSLQRDLTFGPDFLAQDRPKGGQDEGGAVTVVVSDGEEWTCSDCDGSTGGSVTVVVSDGESVTYPGNSGSLWECPTSDGGSVTVVASGDESTCKDCIPFPEIPIEMLQLSLVSTGPILAAPTRDPT